MAGRCSPPGKSRLADISPRTRARLQSSPGSRTCGTSDEEHSCPVRDALLPRVGRTSKRPSVPRGRVRRRLLVRDLAAGHGDDQVIGLIVWRVKVTSFGPWNTTTASHPSRLFPSSSAWLRRRIPAARRPWCPGRGRRHVRTPDAGTRRRRRPVRSRVDPAGWLPGDCGSAAPDQQTTSDRSRTARAGHRCATPVNIHRRPSEAESLAG